MGIAIVIVILFISLILVFYSPDFDKHPKYCTNCGGLLKRTSEYKFNNQTGEKVLDYYLFTCEGSDRISPCPQMTRDAS